MKDLCMRLQASQENIRQNQNIKQNDRNWYFTTRFREIPVPHYSTHTWNLIQSWRLSPLKMDSAINTKIKSLKQKLIL
jgi:hypothetical protein